MKKLIILAFLLGFLHSNDFNTALRAYEANKFEKANEIFQTLCDKGGAKSCFFIAYMNEHAQIREASVQKAHKYYDKACKMRLANACINLGILQRKSGFDNEAILSFNKACKLDRSDACNEVGMFYEADKDMEMATYFYKKSCDLKDFKACFKLGQIYEQGLFVKQNLKTAQTYYSKACNSGLGEACYLLGRYWQQKSDLARAKSYFGRGCNNKHEHSCSAYMDLNKEIVE